MCSFTPPLAPLMNLMSGMTLASFGKLSVTARAILWQRSHQTMVQLDCNERV